MNARLRNALAVAAAATFAVQASAEITFYERDGFDGRSFVVERPAGSFDRYRFNDRASSVEVTDERWEVCESNRPQERCVVLRPGRYPTLAAMGLNDRIVSIRALRANERVADNRYAPLPAVAQTVFYEREGFGGRSFTADRPVANLERFGFNDRASSVEVVSERWEVCEDSRFDGRCVVLRPGKYPSLAAMGLNNRISSMRALSPSERVANDRFAPAPLVGQIVFYENEGFAGRSFSTDRQIANLRRSGFSDRASSIEVIGQRWEICSDAGFGGRCVVVRPGRYASLASLGLDDRISSVRELAANERVADSRYAPAPVEPRITFFEREDFRGQSFNTDRDVVNLRRFGFNDRASSVEVIGERWEVCEDPRFDGRCVVLRPGRYPTLASMGLSNSISSVRTLSWNERIADTRYAPLPVAVGRADDRWFEVPVTSVRAVLGSPEQRCWIEREQVSENRDNVPGAIAGAIIGGILGHQVGGGSGKDLATAGGAVAGAVVGSRIGNRDGAPTQQVERCTNVPSQAQPEYWDVTYNFRGTEHRVQMATPPGRTLTVNAQGEPRS